VNENTKILDHLRKGELQNINMICFIENNEISHVEYVGNSVFVRGTSDREWIYISCSDKNDLVKIKTRLAKTDDNFGAIDSWMVPILLGKNKLLWSLECEQYYLPEEVILPQPKYEHRSLTEEDAVTIYQNSNYQDYISVDYIADRIKHGISAGIFEENTLVAWGMTQDDGGVGFLHVLDDYRRKGYGNSITLSLIEEVRKNGKIPFTYAEESNGRSINLIQKLKFKRHKQIQWFQMG